MVVVVGDGFNALLAGWLARTGRIIFFDGWTVLQFLGSA